MAKARSSRGLSNLPWWLSLLLSMSLSIGTWNPTGIDFIHYVIADFSHLLEGFRPFLVLLMIVLWILAIKSISQSLGLIGAIISLIIIGSFAWGLQQSHLIDFTNLNQVGWLVTISIGLLIWLGLNAAIIWRKFTGARAVYQTEEHHEDE